MPTAPLPRRLAPGVSLLFAALVLNYLVVSTPVSGAEHQPATVIARSPAR